MPSVDLPIALLVLGVMALVAARTFPSFRLLPALRRKLQTPRPPAPPLVVAPSYRRVITGRPATLPPLEPVDHPGTHRPSTPATPGPRPAVATSAPHPAGPLPGPTGRVDGSTDVLDRHREPPDVVAAQALIDHFLDRNPRQVADLLQRWIDNDPPSSRH